MRTFLAVTMLTSTFSIAAFATEFSATIDISRCTKNGVTQATGMVGEVNVKSEVDLRSLRPTKSKITKRSYRGYDGDPETFSCDQSTEFESRQVSTTATFRDQSVYNSVNDVSFYSLDDSREVSENENCPKQTAVVSSANLHFVPTTAGQILVQSGDDFVLVNFTAQIYGDMDKGGLDIYPQMSKMNVSYTLGTGDPNVTESYKVFECEAEGKIK